MKNITLSLKIAAVFIGTVVGAGLASGQEIAQFFTLYGFNGLTGIIVCAAIYLTTGVMTLELSYKYKAASYRDMIYLCCGKYIGFAVDILTTFFLFGGACIILAGSGSIFKEQLNLPYFIGVLVMAVIAAVVVLYSTNGLLFINSIIVPCMIIIITIISMLIFSTKGGTLNNISMAILNAPVLKRNWFLSSILYASFNMLCATGVLCPITQDIKKNKGMTSGVILGAAGLIIITLLINIVLMIFSPGIFNYSIPLLYIAKKLGPLWSVFLSVMIWCEMFSTEVSNIYSLAQKAHHNFKLNYNLSVILILAAAIPFTNIGFANLIKLLYPPFGAVSFVYLLFLIRLYIKEK